MEERVHCIWEKREVRGEERGTKENGANLGWCTNTNMFKTRQLNISLAVVRFWHPATLSIEVSPRYQNAGLRIFGSFIVRCFFLM